MNTFAAPEPPPDGSICRASRGTAFARLVLVTGTTPTDDPIVRVRLLTNEVEMATGVERLLPANRPAGRPYNLLIHEFPGYVLTSDLSAPLWVIDDHEVRDHPAMALTSRRDGRWTWKVQELEAMRALQPPLSVILGEEDEPPRR